MNQEDFVIFGPMEILKDRPVDCSAWCAKNSSVVQCNTIPCCGWFAKRDGTIPLKETDEYKEALAIIERNNGKQ